MGFIRATIAVSVVMTFVAPSIGAGRHSETQVSAAKAFTYHGIGFKDEASRSRKTFTDKFPEATEGRDKIDDRGKKEYEATLDDTHKIKARYVDGILYELEVIGPRLQSSYKKLTDNYGAPDQAQTRGRAFSWTLDNIRITLKIDQSREVVVYRDIKYHETIAKMTETKSP